MKGTGISIIIPTYNGGKIFAETLKRIREQRYEGKLELIIIDSGSNDETVQLARQYADQVIEIDQKTFHHARTRNQALEYASFDQVVYFVQDAIPRSDSCFSDLEKSLIDYDVASVYVRQVPHSEADLYARFEVEYHSKYLGDDPILQQLDSPDAFLTMPYHDALRAIRLDNVCAIYRKKLLIETPFPEVEFAEDMAWGYQNQLLGNRILYQPRITVQHSHNRSAAYRFKRAIINSIACAKIMNRVNEDLSYFSITDLKFLNRQIGENVDKIRLNIKEHGVKNWKEKKRPPSFLQKLRKKYGPTPKPNVQGQIDRYSNHIEHVLGLIQSEYNVQCEKKLLPLLDQIRANVTGTLYGEVYSSYMLRKQLPAGFEKFFKPFLGGV